jgi:hypothetical protein
MTLSTKIYVQGEIGALDVFNFLVHQLLEFDSNRRDFAAVRTTAEADTNWRTKQPTGLWTMKTVIGQGLPAWTMVLYRPGGEYTSDAEARAHDAEICNMPDADHYDRDEPVCDGAQHDPACHLMVDMDTAYGFHGPNGMSCSALHGVMIVRLGEMLRERGVSWQWRNEYTGELHSGFDGLGGLLNAGDEANAWFNGVALPAILADIAKREAE